MKGTSRLSAHRAAPLRAGAALVLVASLALAGPGATAAPGGATPAVFLALYGDSLPAEKVQSALEQELGRTIVMREAGDRRPGGVITIRYGRATSELVVSWDSPDGRTVTRAITARADLGDAVEDAVFLASNLARNEAEEIAGTPPPPSPIEAAAPLPAPRPPAPPQSQRPRRRETSGCSPLRASSSRFRPTLGGDTAPPRSTSTFSTVASEGSTEQSSVS